MSFRLVPSSQCWTLPKYILYLPITATTIVSYHPYPTPLVAESRIHTDSTRLRDSASGCSPSASGAAKQKASQDILSSLSLLKGGSNGRPSHVDFEFHTPFSWWHMFPHIFLNFQVHYNTFISHGKQLFYVCEHPYVSLRIIHRVSFFFTCWRHFEQSKAWKSYLQHWIWELFPQCF